MSIIKEEERKEILKRRFDRAMARNDEKEAARIAELLEEVDPIEKHPRYDDYQHDLE